ncbi:MAG: ATP-binding cassette domain-containing protein [Ornithinimicrobium sp.]|uniref:ABC transporter ATP-binding protein n=1 Tax=Ornithinimicrobium sp. TaxID=1977084 RepID=UPI0026DEF543|nr:ATP-binding cassette domain-containing protein [Ornithinimicrobium sp.]MDO5739805.1 ATP-binding cassette domain-containing protein [Ornithinimicrobium sp.]
MTDPGPGTGLSIRGLTKTFADLKAVDDLSFEVSPGRVTGFLGPNGAGKTTTLRMLLGLIRPTAGEALIGGQRYVELDRPLETVGSALEATGFHPGRSGRDHLRVLAATHGISDRRVDELLELVGIPAAARKRAGEYSMGMRQRLNLAAALLGDPHVLILDEPANGLDPEGIRWMRGFLQHLAGDEGKTVLISSHLLSEVEQTAEDVIIIANGHLVRRGTMEEMHGDPAALVRTSDTARLSQALARAGFPSEPGDGPDALRVFSGDLHQVGEIALAAGLPVHELRVLRTDLERLFLTLTESPEHANRNRGATSLSTGPHPPPPPSQAPPTDLSTHEGEATR